MVTHTKALLVYRTSVLSWAAKADLQPVAVAVADLPTMRGLLVLLDDSGGLAVCYMGTDPLMNPVGFTEVRDVGHWRFLRIEADNEIYIGKGAPWLAGMMIREDKIWRGVMSGWVGSGRGNGITGG